jgi:hypothetical protein
MLRKLYSECRVHIYGDADDILYAGSGLLAIHATSAGTRETALPWRCTVTDMLDHAILATDAEQFSVDLVRHGTRPLQLS